MAWDAYRCLTCICIRCMMRSMELKTYLKDTTDEAFATKLGCSQSQVNRLRHGKAHPSKEMVEKIHIATGGAVTAADWYVLPVIPKPKGKRPMKEAAE